MSAYGSLGNIYGADVSTFPDWLKKQFGADGGNPGTITLPDGRVVVQMGQTPDSINQNAKDGTYSDPSKIWFDPELGYVADASTFKGQDPAPFYKDPMFWGFAGLTGLGLGAQGLFGGLESGLGDSGAFDMGGSSGFGGSTPLASGPADSYWGMLGDSGQVANDAGGGLFDQSFDLMPDFQMDPSFMPEMQMPPFSAADGLPAMAGSPFGGGSLLDRILQNPEAAMRLGLGGASLLSAATGAGNGSGGGGLPWQNGPLPSFTPWQFQFQPNQQNFQPVPFMGGY